VARFDIVCPIIILGLLTCINTQMGAAVNCSGHFKEIIAFMTEIIKVILISGELKSVLCWVDEMISLSTNSLRLERFIQIS
jgi:hypothetical protein